MTAPWWQSAVIYQVYPRSFADSDGDGIGDLPGILARLDHLQALGVDAVWLSPVHPSPMVDNGYDISDHCDVDPVYGSLADLDRLIDALHARGMRFILDLVLNHTSDEHPWFVESRASRDNPKRDWYWWRPPREGTTAGEPGAEPNNWGSFFSGPAWELDPATGEYYLHLFSARQPDLNWENPEVREELYRMMRWWLDRGVDGFRMDVVNMVSKDPDLPDAPALPGAAYGRIGRLAVNGPRIHEFLAELNAAVVPYAGRELLLLGEMPDVSIPEARLYTDPARREVDMVFHFEHCRVDRGAYKWDVLPFDFRVLRRVLADWQEGLADVGWSALYWDNHDQPRAVSRFGDDGPGRAASAKLLGTLLLTQRGTPFVYQGDELGLANHPFGSIEEFDDVESIRWYDEAVARGENPAAVLAALRAMSRDNGRTPMPWDATSHGGFTKGRPWLPLNPDFPTWNAAAQVGKAGSVFEHYRALIALRHGEPALSRGDFTLLSPDDEQLFAFARRHGPTEVVVVANFTREQARLPDTLADRLRGSELLLGESRSDLLEPWETRVHRQRAAAGRRTTVS